MRVVSDRMTAHTHYVRVCVCPTLKLVMMCVDEKALFKFNQRRLIRRYSNLIIYMFSIIEIEASNVGLNISVTGRRHSYSLSLSLCMNVCLSLDLSIYTDRCVHIYMSRFVSSFGEASNLNGCCIVLAFENDCHDDDDDEKKTTKIRFLSLLYRYISLLLYCAN